MKVRMTGLNKIGKRLLSILLLFFIAPFLHAEILNPVKWDFIAQQNSETEAELIFKATIDKGFHLYSQHINPEVGPIPTSFSFAKSKDFKLIGKVVESNPI